MASASANQAAMASAGITTHLICLIATLPCLVCARARGAAMVNSASCSDPFMPREALNAMNDVERRALWAYLRSVPPVPFGHR